MQDYMHHKVVRIQYFAIHCWCTHARKHAHAHTHTNTHTHTHTQTHKCTRIILTHISFPIATQSTLPTPSVGNLLKAPVSPLQTHTNCTLPSKTTKTPFFYAFVAASAIASILLAVLITFGTCTLCCGVWRAGLNDNGKTGENYPVFREERPVPVSHDGAYALYTPHVRAHFTSHTHVGILYPIL